MNRNQLILTHAAVFAVGIAAATVGARFENAAKPQMGTNVPADGSQSAHSGTSEIFHDAASSDHRPSERDGRELSKRSSKPASEQLADIAHITDPQNRQRALMDLVDKLAPGDFKALAEQYRDSDHLGGSFGDFSIILRGWAKRDPLAALEYAGQNGHSKQNSETILSTWANSDPTAAEKWAIDHYQGDGANPYMAAVIQGIAGNDLTEASKLAESMPKGRERDQAVDSITRALLWQSPEAAMAYPESIKDESLRGAFVASIADRLASKDPDKAAAWIAAMTDGNLQNKAARNVADTLAKQDSSKAAAWVSQLKPEAQVEAACGVIPIMSAADIAGTAKWVSSLAGIPNYDKAVQEFIWSCDQRAPEQSAAWIAGITDPDQQRKIYYRMLSDWARRDDAAVKQWVATNNVPNDIRKHFSK